MEGVYLIFVIFFTQAKFLENKIYTAKRQFLRVKSVKKTPLFSAGGLTSLEASLVRCFTFSETSPKTSRGDVFFKTSLEHRTVKQKVRCFYTMF